MTFSFTSSSQVPFSAVSLQALFMATIGGVQVPCKKLAVDKAVNFNTLANTTCNSAADAEFSPAADLPCRVATSAAMSMTTA